jgi:transposase
MKLLLRYDVRRVSCPRCGVRIEQVPWADFGSWFTPPFENLVGYLAQRTDQTTVATTVGDIVQRVVARIEPLAACGAEVATLGRRIPGPP